MRQSLIRHMTIGVVLFALLVPCGAVWTEEPKLMKKFANPNSVGDPLAMNPSGTLIATAGGAGNLLLDAATGETKLELAGHDGAAAFLEFTADGTQLVTADAKKIIIWDLKSYKQVAQIALDLKADSLCLATSAQYIAIGASTSATDAKETDDVSVVLFDRKSYKKVDTVAPSDEFRHRAVLKAIRFDGQGDRLLLGLDQAKGRGREVLQVIDLKKKSPIVTAIDPHDEQAEVLGVLWDIAISPDGKRMAAAGCHGGVKVWDTSTGKPLAEMGRPQGPPGRTTPVRYSNIAFAPDAEHVAVADLGGNVLIWNIGTEKVEHKLEHEKVEDLLKFAQSADGRYLASACKGNIFVWDLTPGKK